VKKPDAAAEVQQPTRHAPPPLAIAAE